MLDLIKNYRLYLFIAITVLILFGYIESLRIRLHHTQAEYATCELNIAQQNAAIQLQVAEAKKLEEKVLEAQKDYEAATQKADIKIQELNAAEVPKKCDAAVKWAKEQL